MNEEIEWWYDISFVTATTKGKLKCRKLPRSIGTLGADKED